MKEMGVGNIKLFDFDGKFAVGLLGFFDCNVVFSLEDVSK